MPTSSPKGCERLEISFPTALDADRELWLAYGCEGWPSLFLWGPGGVLRWFHFGEGEYAATEEAIQEELRALDALARPAAADRAAAADRRAGGDRRRPVTGAVPGRGPRLDRGRGRRGVHVEYEAGGAAVTAEGEGELALTLDGETLEPVAVSGAGLYELTDHPRHSRHRLAIDLAGEVGVWSVSFAPGLPGNGDG